VINLKWSDVDFINKSISIFGKTRRKETIPITDKLAKELAGYLLFMTRGKIPSTRRKTWTPIHSLEKLFPYIKRPLPV
jgi:integrase